MTNILALDIASSTGFARGPIGADAPKQIGSVRFARPGASQLAICGRALEWAIDTIKAPLPDIVAIEGLLPPHVTRGRSNVDHDLLAHLHGIVMAVCFMRGVFKVYKHSVSEIRAHFIDLKTCPRGKQKAWVQERCASLGWIDSDDHDAADACALWSYQAGLLDPEQAIRISPLFQRHRRRQQGAAP